MCTGLLRRVVMNETGEKLRTHTPPTHQIGALKRRQRDNPEVAAWKKAMQDLSQLWFPNKAPKAPAELMEHMYEQFTFKIDKKSQQCN